MIASAALMVAASLIAGRAVLALCRRPESLWLAGPVGLGLLLVVAGIAGGAGGRGTAIAIALGAVLLAALSAGWIEAL